MDGFNYKIAKEMGKKIWLCIIILEHYDDYYN